ncbi:MULTISPECIES: condensation domain-containing protein [unclassified Streptomyces]|uniref:condensation domain-containing protein n=1 Tax=unclassified Streptomyces TaxID=2593676 RepID=UPI002252FAEF|nr:MULTISPECIES: condensation domain-containing protein [unclassified Streptomyces]MCX5337495.1 condensation domain-containing protein [Streptomyces sp. NBC_00140]MCX5365554.1 condensation domain-containing protein [Streptomyces sp. NBC_00124]
MRMTDLQRCEIRPGRLVEWTLHPASVGAARALPDDARPPAYVQESHIRTARTVREDGLFVPTWLGTAFDIPGRVELDVLQGALEAWMLRHETLRSGFRWAGDEMRRFTLDSAAVALHREDIGEFADTVTLTRYLQDRFDVAADALTWPNFLFTAVVRDDGASVYMAFDHSNVDAYSIHRITAEIHELYAAGLDGRVVAPEPVASYVDFCADERSDADRIDDTHQVVGRWREFIARCDGRLPNFPVDLGLDPEGPLPEQRFVQEMLVDAADAAAFEAYCRPYGGSLVGVVAAVALAAREISGLSVYRTVVPFHTRVKSRWADSVGWYVGGAPVEIPVERAVDFDAALELVRTALRDTRALSRMPLARVLRLLGADFRPTSPDLYSIVSYVDSRGIPGAERWQELKAYGLIRVSYGDQVCAWVTRVPEGLQFACRLPDTPAADKNMRRCAELLRARIVAVARETGTVGAGAAARQG